MSTGAANWGASLWSVPEERGETCVWQKDCNFDGKSGLVWARVLEQGLGPMCGIDEAGRGPLAGPVCAAAVILPWICRIDGLNDSKKLTEKKREALFPHPRKKPLHGGSAGPALKRSTPSTFYRLPSWLWKRAVEQLGASSQVGPPCGRQQDAAFGHFRETVIKGTPSVPALLRRLFWQR